MWQERVKTIWSQHVNQTVGYALSVKETIETITGIPGLVNHGLFIGMVSLILLLVTLGVLGKY